MSVSKIPESRFPETRIFNKKVDVISEKQDELNNKVTVLENKPAQSIKKRWDSISDKLLWLFIAGVAGYLLAQALPGIF